MTAKKVLKKKTKRVEVDLGPAPTPGNDIRVRILSAMKQLDDTFIGDPAPNRMIALAYLARVNYLLVGKKGTAKTTRAEAWASHITGSRYFSETLGKFTSPEKVFGLLDPAEFKQGRYVTRTDGMLPWAEHGFLDEMLKPSEGMVNELLGILGPSRTFQRKRTELHVCGGATNWPEVNARSEMTAPLYDRLLLRCEVRTATELSDDKGDNLNTAVQLMKLGRQLRCTEYKPVVTFTMDEVRAVAVEVQGIKIDDIVARMVADFVMGLRAQKKHNKTGGKRPGVDISDRRLVEIQSVLQANAWLEGRAEVTIEDLDQALQFCCWDSKEDIEILAGALDGIDSEVVKKLVAIVDKGREAKRELDQSGYDPGPVNRALGRIKRAAAAARELYDQPVFTRRGREQAKNALQKLKEDFQEIRDRNGSTT